MINISFKEGNKIINLKASICKNTDIYNKLNGGISNLSFEKEK